MATRAMKLWLARKGIKAFNDAQIAKQAQGLPPEPSPAPDRRTPPDGWSMPPGKCYYCGQETDGGDYCYGCGVYVCEKCDAPLEHRPHGTHAIEDHRRFRGGHG